MTIKTAAYGGTAEKLCRRIFLNYELFVTISPEAIDI